MGALSSNERKALDDIFLSIDTKNNRDYIIKHIVFFIHLFTKHTKSWTKSTKITKFINFFYKKKKTLSK